jgi:hypothetical protein
LGDGHAFEGEQFLGIDGLVAGDEVGAEVSDFVDIFEADDGEAGGGEAMLAGVLGGAGLACRRSWSGRTGGIGAVGGELLFGNGLLRLVGGWGDSDSGIGISFRPMSSTRAGRSLKSGGCWWLETGQLFWESTVWCDWGSQKTHLPLGSKEKTREEKIR